MANFSKVALEQVVLKKGATPLIALISPKIRLNDSDVLKVFNDFGPDKTVFVELEVCDVVKFIYIPRTTMVFFATISSINLAAYKDGVLADHGLEIGDKVRVTCQMGTTKKPFTLVLEKLVS